MAIEETTDEAELLAAVTELGAALRELVAVSVTTTVGPAELRAAAAQARAAAAGLAVSRRSRDQLPALDDPAQFRRVYNPVSGVGSALAPPLAIRRVDGGVEAETTLGLPYEGPPSYVHGGMSALLLDQVLSSAAHAAGLWGMTGRLELDYRRPVPLETALLLRAAVGGRHGRRVTISGSIALAERPDDALVQARGMWVTPRPQQVEEYFRSITDAAGRPSRPGRPSDATAVDDGS
ncbi:PaaI family thioesterase [Modestobacter excelsi]|uniref:PaaI family thioesterase n=1 Tax=Modestobacter excelsi TaxID=2213161 RepID=UPI00110CB0BB|nr:hotdog domain-containing protein [Modestobacter excelsi]